MMPESSLPKKRGRKPKGATEAEKKLTSIIQGGELSKNDAMKFEDRKREFREGTKSQLTELEYTHLAKIALWLDLYEEHERKVGVEEIPPALVQQARLYRELILSRLSDVRHEQGGEGTFLQKTQQEVKKIEEAYGADLEKIKKEFESTILDLKKEVKKDAGS